MVPVRKVAALFSTLAVATVTFKAIDSFNNTHGDLISWEALDGNKLEFHWHGVSSHSTIRPAPPYCSYRHRVTGALASTLMTWKCVLLNIYTICRVSVVSFTLYQFNKREQPSYITAKRNIIELTIHWRLIHQSHYVTDLAIILMKSSRKLVHVSWLKFQINIK